MTDPGVMPGEERHILIGKLREIDPGIGSDLEEEQVDRSETTTNRMKAFYDAECAQQLEEAMDEYVFGARSG